MYMYACDYNLDVAWPNNICNCNTNVLSLVSLMVCSDNELLLPLPAWAEGIVLCLCVCVCVTTKWL